ncbi:MAG: RecX family transcriptional regulator [Sphingobacteriales bacterium]|nr:RecX family transcriptional regulator [Sphingobacteriales bacterium]
MCLSGAFYQRNTKFLKKHQATPQQSESVIHHLQTHNFLQQQRFALMLAQGKFRIKKWGKLKIRQALQQKGVAETDIRQALENIDKESYQETLKTIAEKKLALIKEENPLKRRQKLIAFLLQKGYEMEEILHIIPSLINTISE